MSKKKNRSEGHAANDASMAVSHAPVVLDIEGLTLSADDRRRLAHPLTGGLILFARNWRDRTQLTSLCAEIKSIRPDVLICVDHEGGRVQRFKTDGFTHVPAMRRLGEMWMNDGKGGEGAGAMAATDAATAWPRVSCTACCWQGWPTAANTSQAMALSRRIHMWMCLSTSAASRPF